MRRYTLGELKEFLGGALSTIPTKPIRHVASGDLYEILFLSLRESDLVILATYAPVGAQIVMFTRPLRDIQAKFVRTDSCDWGPLPQIGETFAKMEGE